MSYERAYIEGLKTEFIEAVKRHVKSWRAGNDDADYCMYDIETWVHEIWGDEE
jgi:hypothetical protein